MPSLANKPLANPRHLAFIRCVAMGQTATDAYRATVATDPRNTGCHVGGARLRAKYALQIEELHGRFKRAAEDALVLDKTRLARFLSAVVMADPCKLDDNSGHLCQEALEWTDNDGNRRVRRKLASKTDCANQLARLLGLAEPERHDHLHAHLQIDTPALQALRAARQDSAYRLPDAATGTAEGNNGHLAEVWVEAAIDPAEGSNGPSQVWTDPDELV